MLAPLLACLMLLGCIVAGAVYRRGRRRRKARAMAVDREPDVPTISPETARWQAAALEATATADGLRAQLRETQRELASLTYSISHDMRAPLRGIDGFSQALAEDYTECLDATALDYLRRVRAGAAQLNLLIDDLLSLSRIVRAPFQPEQVDLSALVNAAAAELSAAEPLRDLCWDVQPGVIARGDRALLDVALRHLLVNAWKFTASRPAARISFRVLDQPGAAWPAGVPVYEVRDNGAGFDMKYAGKLFGAFQKMHAPEDFPAGRGIGLATVQRIVARHNGVVRADAVPQEGAAFTFTLCGADATARLPAGVHDYSLPGMNAPAAGRPVASRHSTSAH